MFTNSAIIVAIPLASLAFFNDILEEYGEELSIAPGLPNSPKVKTLAGFKDREGSDDLRAAQLNETVFGTILTNNKMAFTAHFTQSFVDALSSDPRSEGVEILTPEQLAELTPPQD